MKIICVDNYDRDHVADILIAENVDQRYGELITKFLNSRFSGVGSSDYYRLVNDGHKLWRGWEEIV